MLPTPDVKPGPVAWMVRNRVTANILMLTFLVGGFIVATQIKQEVFPDFELDIVAISVPYPGASPEEVERGIVLVIEEAIRGLDGVKEVTAQASEGFGSVTAELFEDANQQKVYQEIKQEIDRVTTFPEEAEEPEVVLQTHRHEVLTVEVYGNVGEWAMRGIVEQVRDRLLLDPEITQIEIHGARDYEVHIEVPQENLRAYGLTLDAVARKVGATSVELPGGKIETRGGEILLRMTERRDWARQFAHIPIVTTPEGTILYLDDIATVRDTFEDTDSLGTYNGALRDGRCRLPRRQADSHRRLRRHPPRHEGDRPRPPPRRPLRHPQGPLRHLPPAPHAAPQERGHGAHPRPRPARPVPGDAPRLLGHHGHPHLLPGRVPLSAAHGRHNKYDVDVCIHRRPGHRRRRRHRRRREHLRVPPPRHGVRRGRHPGRTTTSPSPSPSAS